LIEAAAAMRPELLLVVKGEMITGRTLEIIKKKATGCRVVMWQNDNLDEVDLSHIKEAVGQYDVFFTYDRGDLPKAAGLGFKRVEYLPTGFDPDIFRPVTPSASEKSAFSCDLAFVGRAYPKRIKYLAQIPKDIHLKIFGSPYPDSFPVAAKYIPLAQVNFLYNCARIGLSLHEDERWQGVNNRTFEICGAGCLCLVDKWNDIPAMFEVGKEIITYDSPEAMNEQIRRYLGDESARRRIARAARQRAHAQHTFQHRVHRLISLLG